VNVIPSAQARPAYEQLGRLFDEKLADYMNRNR
jgi:hypothetical protein